MWKGEKSGLSVTARNSTGPSPCLSEEFALGLPSAVGGREGGLGPPSRDRTLCSEPWLALDELPNLYIPKQGRRCRCDC